MSAGRSEDDAFGVRTLAELIAEQKRLRGFSYRDLEARAEHAISHQRWQQLGSGVRVKEFSEPTTIRAMAHALDVDETLVVLAMAKSIGLKVERGGAQSALARMLPGSARELTAEQRNAILAMVRTMTQTQSQSSDESESPAATRLKRHQGRLRAKVDDANDGSEKRA